MGPESNTAPEMVFTLSFLYPFLNPWLHPTHPRFSQNFQVDGSPEAGEIRERVVAFLWYGLFIGKTLFSNLQKDYKNSTKNSSTLSAKIHQVLIICSIHACAIMQARTPPPTVYIHKPMCIHIIFSEPFQSKLQIPRPLIPNTFVHIEPFRGGCYLRNCCTVTLLWPWL